MTSPDGVSPDGSIALGMFAARQAQTEEQARQEATNGAWQGAWNGAQTGFHTTMVAPIHENQVDVRSLDRRVTVLEGVGTRTIYTLSQTWTNPAPTERLKVGVGVFCGGHGGARGVAVVGHVAQGGDGAAWIYRELWTDELPENIAIMVGSAGSPNSGLGGVSSFGSYVVGGWGKGGIMTVQGVLETTSSAGRGGNGGSYNSDNQFFQGTAGESSALARGGNPASASVNAQPGEDAPLDALSPSGGGGGGGGFGGQGILRSGQAGGFPGGGGGGGATGNEFLSYPTSNGGGGGPGAVLVTVFGVEEGSA